MSHRDPVALQDIASYATEPCRNGGRPVGSESAAAHLVSWGDPADDLPKSRSPALGPHHAKGPLATDPLVTRSFRDKLS